MNDDLDFGANTLFDPIQDWGPEIVHLAARFQAECERLDAKRADLAFQKKVEAGYGLDAHELEDWRQCMAVVARAFVGEER